MKYISAQECIRDIGKALKLHFHYQPSRLQRKIRIPRVQRPGLALTGESSLISSGRIQILGNAELNYLTQLKSRQQTKTLEKYLRIKVPFVIVTRGLKIPQTLVTLCKENKTPLLSTNLSTPYVIRKLQEYLQRSLSPKTTEHGVLVDVSGVGILLRGKSGVGKSECALELVMRGHRLVADDIVHLALEQSDAIIGTADPILKNHIEVRGLGILNIHDLFGTAAIADQMTVDLVIELTEWDPKGNYERVGVKEQTVTILDTERPYILLPIRLGRSITTIVEVAARNQLLKTKGIFSAQEFHEALARKLSKES